MLWRMILSEKKNFIFVKTRRTAGTSIEVFLNSHLGPRDVATPIHPPERSHTSRNARGRFNPIPEFFLALRGARYADLRRTLHDLKHARRFWNHMPAGIIRARTSDRVWQRTFKFCVERNPWDKTLSFFHMLKRRGEVRTLDEFFARRLYPSDWMLYTDENGELLVDRILSFERLNEELADVFNLLGIPFDGALDVRAKTAARSRHLTYRDVLNGAQKKSVEKAFHREIEALGYRW